MRGEIPIKTSDEAMAKRGESVRYDKLGMTVTVERLKPSVGLVPAKPLSMQNTPNNA